MCNQRLGHRTDKPQNASRQRGLGMQVDQMMIIMMTRIVIPSTDS